MKRVIVLGIVVFVAFVCFINARTKSDEMSIRIPKDWPEPHYKFEKNKLTKAGFELGRKLFYDPRVSRNNTVSCGSCHQPFAAFAHIDHNVSHGIDNKMGTRNAPGLFNLIWQTSFMWDGGVNHIEVQPLAPMTNPVNNGSL
jgi:cytochrome c peroxidase